MFWWNNNNKSFTANFPRTLIINYMTLLHLWLIIRFDLLNRWQQKVTHTHALIKQAQSSATFRCMGQRYIKPIFGRYRLHSLHRQFCGHRFLIPDLKVLKVFTSFNSVGTTSQILRPKNDRLSVPLHTLLTGGIEKCKVWRSW